MASSAAAQQSIQIRVLAASTGVSYPIRLYPNELTVANIKRHLAGAVPPQDQILLLGPPYKVPKDASLRSEEVLSALRLGDREDDAAAAGVPEASGDEGGKGRGGRGGGGGGGGGGALNAAERTGAKRLFLFSKRALSDSAPDPPPCRLEPTDLSIPTTADPSPVVFPRDAATGAPSSPLHQALQVYERRFMLDLCRGRTYADGADLRLSACRTCASEQAVMARALRAAVSNLSDHRNGAARTRTEFSANFQGRTAAHAALLGRFESCLAALEGVALHPALARTARASGRVMETLLDTVPVERERAWAAQCQTAHNRLRTLYAELDGAFGQIGTAASREEEARLDLKAEEEIQALSDEVETTAVEIRNRQAGRLGTLTSNHGEVVRVVTNAISDGGSGGGGGGGEGGLAAGSLAQAAFASLEEMAKASSDIVPQMEAEDVALKELMAKVADAKTRAMKRMKTRLRQISIAQSAIQRVISNVAVVRDALAQQCDNMVHLEHVAELPSSYRDFLSEIRRRRAYGDAVTSTAEAMVERLATMRADETKSREKFLRGPGRHLMPAFFEIFAPTLATPPPLFTPQLPALVEMDALPDVGPPESGEVGRGEAPAAGGGSSSLGSDQNESPIQRPISAEGHGVSSASTLTDGSQAPAQGEKDAGDEQQGVAGATDTESSEVPPRTPGAEKRGGHAPEQLIVSADEHSNDVIMDTACTEVDGQRAASDAERKTLAYENAVLRQAIERMGGKSPRKYLVEALEREREEERERRKAAAAEEESRGRALAALTAELGSVKAELERARGEVREANRKLAAAKSKGGRADKKPCDKISHSSFEVGDIGLFMPTGLTIKGGKRTYLAFHSNCPHRYLSTDNIEGTPDFVLGRIIYVEELYAGPMGTDSNPYGLHVGTKFWVLTVEPLRSP